MRYGAQHQTTACVGWRLPVTLANAVRAKARENGVTPARLVTEILNANLAKAFAPIGATELAARVRYPDYFNRLQ
jgi:hypothetical protein